MDISLYTVLIVGLSYLVGSMYGSIQIQVHGAVSLLISWLLVLTLLLIATWLQKFIKGLS